MHIKTLHRIPKTWTILTLKQNYIISVKLKCENLLCRKCKNYKMNSVQKGFSGAKNIMYSMKNKKYLSFQKQRSE